MTVDDLLRILEAVAWPLTFAVVFSRAIFEWVDVRRLDRAAAMEQALLVEQRHTETALRVAEIETRHLRSTVAIESHNAELERHAIDILRTVVGTLGGIPGKESSPGQTSRGIVRELRALMDEVDEPTPAPAADERMGAGDLDELDALDRELFDDDPTEEEFASAVEEGMI